MPRSPSLLLTVFFATALASATVRGGWSQPPAAPRRGAPSNAPSTRTDASEAGDREPSSRLLQQSPAPRAARRKGLMIGGLTALGGTYMLTVLLALNGLGSTNGMVSGCLDCKARPRLLVPIAGPWMAIPYGARNDTTLFAVLGLAQATGVALSIIGISRFVADAPTPRVSLGFLPVSNGAFGFAAARF